MNGWQRIWFVLTMVIWICAAILYPAYMVAQSVMKLDESIGRPILAEYASGKCNSYISEPLASLTEPDSNRPPPNCSYIYNLRTIDSKRGLTETPYTLEQFKANNQAKAWEKFRSGFDPISILVALGSVVVYFLGWLIAWVRRGF